MKHNSASMRHIDTIRHIPEEKKSLNPTYRWMIGIDDFLEIISYLYQSFRKRKSGLCLNHSIFNHTQNPLFFLEKSKPHRRGSWIKSENYHEVII